MDKSYDKYIESIRKVIEQDIIDEVSSVTAMGGQDGYLTPKAFVGKNTKKRKFNSLGYTRVDEKKKNKRLTVFFPIWHFGDNFGHDVDSASDGGDGGGMGESMKEYDSHYSNYSKKLNELLNTDKNELLWSKMLYGSEWKIFKLFNSNDNKYYLMVTDSKSGRSQIPTLFGRASYRVGFTYPVPDEVEDMIYSLYKKLENK